MQKKKIYALVATLSLAGVVFATGIASNASETDDSSTASQKQILQLDKEDAWTDYVPFTGRDNPVYVGEDEIIYTDSQGNKVFEYLNPVDPGNEPATMPDMEQSTQGDIQGDVMAIDESFADNTSTNTYDSTNMQSSSNASNQVETNVQSSSNASNQVETNAQSSSNASNLVDTNTQLATGTSKVVENENGLLIQVFE